MSYYEAVMNTESRKQPLLAASLNSDNTTSILSRDLTKAREAYSENDQTKSRSAHQARNISKAQSSNPHLEPHTEASSDNLKAFVFGGLDGTVTIFAVVAGCMGAHLTPIQIIIVGAGNVLADAVSMGLGEYMSAKTEYDYTTSEREREAWEIQNYPEGEKQEMMEIYQHKYNFTFEDAQIIVETSFKYPDFYITHMMAEELGLLCDTDGPSPIQRGIVMFLAFVLFGLVPLVAFTFWSLMLNGWRLDGAASDNHKLQSFVAASVFSCMTLFLLGVAKATLLQQKTFIAGLQMMINGGLAGFVAFGVGLILRRLVGDTNV